MTNTPPNYNPPTAGANEYLAEGFASPSDLLYRSTQNKRRHIYDTYTMAGTEANDAASTIFFGTLPSDALITNVICQVGELATTAGTLEVTVGWQGTDGTGGGIDVLIDGMDGHAASDKGVLGDGTNGTDAFVAPGEEAYVTVTLTPATSPTMQADEVIQLFVEYIVP